MVEPGSPEADVSPTGFGVRIVDADAATRDRLEALIERVKASGATY